MGGERHSKRGGVFGWFNVTQFLGALNDNFFKLLVAFFLIGRLGETASASVMAAGAAVFVVPFLLFTAPAGMLADRFPKARLVVALKAAEVGVAALGVAALWSRHPPLLYATLFLLAAQSALFAPAKYGIVPELVAKDQLAQANASLSLATQLAIIGGTALAPLLTTASGGNYAAVSVVCVGVAVVGFGCSLRMCRAAGTRSTKTTGSARVAGGTALQVVRGDRDLRGAMLASAALTAIGAHL